MKLKYFLLLLICICSRAFTSIYYIEDIDSLRFALANESFDVVNNQPHFPGYPIFCFLAIIFFEIFGSSALSFSIIGGISIFIIYYYLEKILCLYNGKKHNWVVFLLVFTHPFLWVMSNRYMPDIFGLSILVAAVYYLIVSLKKNNTLYAAILFFLIGLESGTRLSYAPFFLPAIFLFVKYKKKILTPLISFIFSVSLWLLPLIMISGLAILIDIGMRNTSGHFFEWGGAITSSTDSYFTRLLGMLRTIVSEVFSSWWPGRHGITLLMSLLSIIILTYLSLSKKLTSLLNPQNITLIFCLLTYLLWVFFFQNVVYKPRHLLPLIPFWLLIVGFFQMDILKKSKIFSNLFIVIFLTCQTFICVNLVMSHLEPSAISQTKDWIKKNSSKDLIICADGLFNFYYKKHADIKQLKYISSKSKGEINSEFNSGKKICSYINLDEIVEESPTEIIHFYHNPSVNRLWSHLKLRIYEKQKE